MPLESGYYVEIGANDGISQSNTNFLERRHEWQGVLIEPVPSLFQKLIKNRSHKNFFWNVACCSFEHDSDLIEMTYGDLMSVSHFRNIDIDPDIHISEAESYLASNEHPYKFLAQAKTLQSVLELSNAPNLIDFFSLDVEGAEIEVLSGIDFDIYMFRFILIESRTFDRINIFLQDKGYVFVESLSNHDYLFRSCN